MARRRFALNGKLVKGLAAVTAVGGGLALRHYGYKFLTGIDESWMDSTIHTSGSLASAAAVKVLVGKPSVSKALGDGATRIQAAAKKVAGATALGLGIEAATQEMPQSNRYNEMLRKAQQPIKNEPLPTQKPVGKPEQPPEKDSEKKKP